ncbi:thioredoxin family protein [Oscillatoria laete-virens NRMC-F 0139]|nr:thioredoxin family protein [Oscillatoria laete-virens]MDL5054344.1 thioredoxin family protein [Oscillatoria laete-virens NRMC-F 0139]
MKLKHLLLLPLAGFVFLSACSKQESAPDEPKTSAADDIVEPVHSSDFEGWLTSEKAAFDQASGMDRPVLILFTGSDWCPPCMMMEKEVFNSQEFKQFAADNLVLLVADFPNAKAQSAEQKSANEELSKKYGIEGFPTMVLVAADGKKLWQHVGYLPGGPAALIAAINQNNQ